MTNYSADTRRKKSQAARNSSADSARRRKCPRCLRLAALSAKVDYPDGHARRCNYCGHEVGITMGRVFGRDVTPEPGAKS